MAYELEKASTHHTTQPGEPAARTPTAQDWTGPGDAENPMNWSLTKRTLHMIPIAFLAFAVTAGSSLITPATEEIAQHFHVSVTAAILSLSLFVVGLGIGPIIAAPLSEHFGRNAVYVTTAPVYMLFILGAGFSKSFGGLLVCRLLAGIAGGPVLAVGSGTTADMFPTRIRAIPASIYIMAPFLGPALGPVIGGFAAQYKGYKWTQWSTIFIGLVAWALVLPMQETYKKTILQRRAKRLNIPPPPTPHLGLLPYARKILRLTVARPLGMLFTEPIVLFFSLYISFVFSVLFALFAAFPYTFRRVYGFNTWQSGLTFLSIGLGNLLGLIMFVVLDRRVYARKHAEAVTRDQKAIAPEHRLYGAMIGAPGVAIGLFWFAWTARSSVHWISPVLAGVPFAFGNMGIFVSSALYMIDVYGPLSGASALAANGLARYTMAAGFPLFTIQMYSSLGIDWATSLLGFVSVLFLPIPFIFFKYGPQIRRKSRYNIVTV
ncbi:hypothetical protein M433DRAFT_68591 [Acidomyces richmondensis BFW]|nr:MAG: hypothetical protein FE78DRAFT_150768 [Acidomyces sp. 'richmondensis']KYG44803.1 hypothetical protein M433DRAFT_68591 [Acidomyces richmondensis BFW]